MKIEPGTVVVRGVWYRVVIVEDPEERNGWGFVVERSEGRDATGGEIWRRCTGPEHMLAGDILHLTPLTQRLGQVIYLMSPEDHPAIRTDDIR